MHQMVSMAGQSESAPKPPSGAEAAPEVKNEAQMEVDQPNQPVQPLVQPTEPAAQVPPEAPRTTEQL